jgi:hypothetical protein
LLFPLCGRRFAYQVQIVTPISCPINEVLDIEMPWIFDRYGVGGVEFKKTEDLDVGRW